MNPVYLPFFIPLFPLAAFMAIAFVTRHFKGSKISAAVSIIGNLLAFGVSAMVLLQLVPGFHPPWSFTLGPQEQSFSWIELPKFGSFPALHLQVGILVDPLSAIMAFMVTLVSTLIMIYSTGYMSEDPAYSLFFSYLSLFVSAMLTIVFSNNFLLTYAGWELVGLCSYLLIGFWYKKPSAASAAVKAFVVTRTGDVGFLIGIILLYYATGTLNFHELSGMNLHALFAGWLSWGIPLLIFCGAVGKSAQFPLHVWLPDAMEGPTPVSALIHAATMVAAGVYMVARSYFLFVQSPVALLAVAWIGGFTAILAATMALVQWDIKRSLAYSTVSQLGYMILALGAGPIGFVAAIFHLLTHAFFKALLFLGAGSVSHPFHDKENPFDMHHYGGLAKKMPHTYWTFLFATLAITGCFPFAGFFSKDEILSSVFHSGLPTHMILWGIGLFTAFLTSCYMFRLLFLTFHGGKEPDKHAHESPFSMVAPLAVLGVFALGAGLAGVPGHSWIERFFEPITKMYPVQGVGVDQFGMAAGTGVFLLGLLTAWILYGRGLKFASWTHNALILPFYRLFENKWYMDDFWNAFLQLFFYKAAAAASWIDTNVVDGIVRMTGYLTDGIGKKLRLSQTGLVQQYALVVVVSLLAAAWFLRYAGGHFWIL